MLSGRSDSEQDEQAPLAVYDFLYRDRLRIESYYAQIFGGRTLSLEKTQSVRKQREWTIKASVGALSGERRSPDEVAETAKQVIDPHDTATIDVLQWLAQNDYIAESAEAAREGHFVRLHGSLILADSRLLLATAKSLSANSGGGKAARQQRLGADVFAHYSMPPMFALRSERGPLCAGTLTDDGMAFQLSSHTWKFGQHAMRNVHLIGVIEDLETSDTDEKLFDLVMNMARPLNEWFPASAIRVTPLVMYRRLVSLAGRCQAFCVNGFSFLLTSLNA
jgi:hypothetical protein